MQQRPTLLLVASAALYAAAAIPLLFAPAELLRLGGAEQTPLVFGLLQVLGSALFGFAMLNWMQRFSRIDGIFGRPLVVANLAHAGSAALLLAKAAVSAAPSPLLLAALGAYAVLGVAFGRQMFAAPAAPG
jgi:hypothetical protein